MASHPAAMRSIIVLMSCLAVCHSYKVLVLVPIPIRSHFNLGKGVADILHMRGHEVTIVSCYPSKNPQYREITTPDLIETKNDKMLNFNITKESNFRLILKMYGWLSKIVEISLENPQVQHLMNEENETFDLIVLDHVFNDAFLGLAVKYDCSVIALSPTSMLQNLASATGNPICPAAVPNMLLNLQGNNMNMLQRTANTIIAVVSEIFERYFVDNVQAEIYQKHFPEEASKVDFYDLNERIAMVFINSYHSVEAPRPLLPNAVEIGGFHIGEVKPLTKEFQEIMDNAKDGVIFFSLGSNIKTSLLPPDVRNGILKSLGKLKQTVLWKFENDLPGKPDNVIIKNWMPQTSILDNPNLKLFISHGGMLSITEAVAAGVPILVIPIFGDQYHNSKTIESHGNALLLDFNNITETSMTWALNEALTNSKYLENAKRMQRLFNDRPIHPRDLVSFYAEHVIRTGGAKHKTAPKLSLFSELLLDVALVLFLPLLVLSFLSAYLCSKCYKKNGALASTTTKDKHKKN